MEYTGNYRGYHYYVSGPSATSDGRDDSVIIVLDDGLPPVITAQTQPDIRMEAELYIDNIISNSPASAMFGGPTKK